MFKKILIALFTFLVLFLLVAHLCLSQEYDLEDYTLYTDDTNVEQRARDNDKFISQGITMDHDDKGNTNLYVHYSASNLGSEGKILSVYGIKDTLYIPIQKPTDGGSALAINTFQVKLVVKGEYKRVFPIAF